MGWNEERTVNNTQQGRKRGFSYRTWGRYIKIRQSKFRSWTCIPVVHVEAGCWGLTRQNPGSESPNHRHTEHLQAGHTHKNASLILRSERLESCSDLLNFKAKSTSTAQVLNFYLSNEQISIYDLQQSKKFTITIGESSFEKFKAIKEEQSKLRAQYPL